MPETRPDAPRLRLITRGDDLGCNHTANVAIRDAYQQGILRNTSIMTPAPAIGHAAELLVGKHDLCCGLHCTITAEWDNVRWGPVLPPDEVPSLVDRDGHFFQTTRTVAEHGPRLNEIMAELRAQLQRARELGFEVRYADTHMGFAHIVDGLAEAIDAWCTREGIRNARHYGRRLPPLDAAQAAATGSELDPVEQFIARLATAPPGQYLIVGHPAYDTPEMHELGHEGMPGDRVAVERDWQRRLFMDPRVVAYCRENGVLPIRYDEAERL
ncbi:MAG: ChbG/HpnK family deacetylase [Anaerolineae bacterium]